MTLDIETIAPVRDTAEPVAPLPHAPITYAAGAYIVCDAGGREVARFDAASRHDPLWLALAEMRRGDRRSVIRASDGRMLATSVPAEMAQPIDAFGSSRGRRRGER